MATLRTPRTAPPGGFFYFQKETRLRIKADNLDELVGRVIEHRQQNRLEPTDRISVSLGIQQQICARLGKSHCRREGPDDPWVPRAEGETLLTLQSVMAASRAAFEWLGGGMKLVDMEENHRRHEICADCPLNQPMTGCRCSVLFAMIAKVVPENRRFGDLHVCHACGCSLAAKCAAPLNVLRASEEGRNVSYPAWCWMAGLADAK